MVRGARTTQHEGARIVTGLRLLGEQTHTHARTHTGAVHARTRVGARARSQSRLRGRRKFLECVGGETAATGNAMDDRAAIVALCQICLRNRLNQFPASLQPQDLGIFLEPQLFEETSPPPNRKSRIRQVDRIKIRTRHEGDDCWEERILKIKHALCDEYTRKINQKITM